MLAYCVLCGEPDDAPEGFTCESCWVAGPRGNGFVDMTGQRFGAWTVLGFIGFSQTAHASLWLCRCDCGRVLARQSLAIRERSGKCFWCAARETGDKRRVPEAERLCRWCRRNARSGRGPVNGPHAGPAYECAACERMAFRNGRESDGRPIAKGPRRVLSGASPGGSP